MIFIIYLLISFALFFFQKSLIYPAPKTPLTDCQLPSGLTFFDEQIGETKITGLYSQNNHRKLFVFFHGNAESACNWKHLANQHVSKHGYDTLILEYPGYAGAPGDPSYKNNLKMLEALAEWIDNQKYDTYAVMGVSLGTGMASTLASKINSDLLILAAPFDTMPSLAQSKFPIYPKIILTEKYNNIKALENFDNLVIVLHGTRDLVVPRRHTLNLTQTLKNHERIELPDKGHNQILENAIIDELLSQYLP